MFLMCSVNDAIDLDAPMMIMEPELRPFPTLLSIKLAAQALDIEYQAQCDSPARKASRSLQRVGKANFAFKTHLLRFLEIEDPE